MPRIDLSSAGVSVNYAVESSAGVRPTTGYTRLTGVKAIPDLNPEPGTLDTTTLDELVYRTFIPGLKDTGGALSFTANNTEAFQTEWSEMQQAAETAANSGLSTWFVIVIPGLTNAFYFAGMPSPLGLSSIEVDSVLEIDGYITPSEIVGWAAKPTAE